MTRRTWITSLGTVLAMCVLLLVASSGPVRIWDTPSSSVGSPSQGADPVGRAEPTTPPSTGQVELPHWLSDLLGVLSAAVIALGLVAAVIFGATGQLPQLGSRVRRERNRHQLSALPEVDERALQIDIESARAALVGGTPRNAIVACWMQLERDTAAAGLARLAAETPAEYVERVVAASSVDPAPIGELAALYREARFSRHQLSDDHRTRALAALDRVAAQLGREVEVPV